MGDGFRTGRRGTILVCVILLLILILLAARLLRAFVNVLPCLLQQVLRHLYCPTQPLVSLYGLPEVRRPSAVGGGIIAPTCGRVGCCAAQGGGQRTRRGCDQRTILLGEGVAVGAQCCLRFVLAAGTSWADCATAGSWAARVTTVRRGRLHLEGTDADVVVRIILVILLVAALLTGCMAC